MYVLVIVFKVIYLSEFIFFSFILINFEVFEGIGVFGSGNDVVEMLIYNISGVIYD